MLDSVCARACMVQNVPYPSPPTVLGPEPVSFHVPDLPSCSTTPHHLIYTPWFSGAHTPAEVLLQLNPLSTSGLISCVFTQDSLVHIFNLLCSFHLSIPVPSHPPEHPPQLVHPGILPTPSGKSLLVVPPPDKIIPPKLPALVGVHTQQAFTRNEGSYLNLFSSLYPPPIHHQP